MSPYLPLFTAYVLAAGVPVHEAAVVIASRDRADEIEVGGFMCGEHNAASPPSFIDSEQAAHLELAGERIWSSVFNTPVLVQNWEQYSKNSGISFDWQTDKSSVPARVKTTCPIGAKV